MKIEGIQGKEIAEIITEGPLCENLQEVFPEIMQEINRTWKDVFPKELIETVNKLEKAVKQQTLAGKNKKLIETKLSLWYEKNRGLTWGDALDITYEDPKYKYAEEKYKAAREEAKAFFFKFKKELNEWHTEAKRKREVSPQLLSPNTRKMMQNLTFDSKIEKLNRLLERVYYED